LEERDCPSLCNDACLCVVKRPNCAAMCERCLYAGVPCGTRPVRQGILKGRTVSPRPVSSASPPSFLEATETVYAQKTDHRAQQQQERQQQQQQHHEEQHHQAAAQRRQQQELESAEHSEEGPQPQQQAQPPLHDPVPAAQEHSNLPPVAEPSKSQYRQLFPSQLPDGATPNENSVLDDSLRAFTPAASQKIPKSEFPEGSREAKIARIMDLQAQIIQMLSTRSPSSLRRVTPPTQESSQQISSSPDANALLLQKLHEIMTGDVSHKVEELKQTMATPAFPSPPPTDVTPFPSAGARLSPLPFAMPSEPGVRVIPLTVPIAIRLNADGSISPFIASSVSSLAIPIDSHLAQLNHRKLERIVSMLESLISWVKRKKQESGEHYGSQVDHITELLNEAVDLTRRSL